MPARVPPAASRLRRLIACASGATAVEFAFIAMPFFMLLIGILELGLMFMASTTINAATQAEARLIRTGQFQAGGSTSMSDFKTALCNNMSWISTSDCMANMSLDVRTFPNFAAISVPPPIVNGALDSNQLQFTPGASCDIVLVRVYYPWTLLAPVLEPGLPDLGSNKKLLTTAVAFRNENWAAGGPPCS